MSTRFVNENLFVFSCSSFEACLVMPFSTVNIHHFRQ